MTQVRDIMEKNVITIDYTKNALDASVILKEKEISFLVILKNGKPEGIISERDIVRKIAAKDIKSSQIQLEDEAHFIGVFMYRNGTAYDYESVKGICYFYNNIDRKELPEITKFLQGKYKGKEMEKGDRIILKGSDEIYSATDIAELAKGMEAKFNVKAVISLEFGGITAEALKEAGLPDAKLLPIPT